MKRGSQCAAVITGAGGGIGKAIAARLAAKGVQLHLIGRNREKLRALAGQIKQKGAPVQIYQADLAKDKDLHNLEGQFRKTVPRVDFLIHCAGLLTLGRIEEAAVKDLDAQYRINVRAPYVLSRALLPLMKESHGQIVFINSSIWQHARAGIGQYAATKYALKGLTDSLRDEVNGDGIRVLSVFLGRTATPMQEAVHVSEGLPYRPEYLIQPEDVAGTITQVLELPRTSEVTDIHIRPMRKLPVNG